MPACRCWKASLLCVCRWHDYSVLNLYAKSHSTYLSISRRATTFFTCSLFFISHERRMWCCPSRKWVNEFEGIHRTAKSTSTHAIRKQSNTNTKNVIYLIAHILTHAEAATAVHRAFSHFHFLFISETTVSVSSFVQTFIHSTCWCLLGRASAAALLPRASLTEKK